MKMRRFIFLIAVSFVVLGLAGGPAAPQQGGPAARKVIIFVWDGLRADDVTPENMPNYFALARSGVVFADHHAVYPTFTMMNSASMSEPSFPKCIIARSLPSPAESAEFVVDRLTRIRFSGTLHDSLTLRHCDVGEE